MTGLTDGRGNETTNTYNSANQVTAQKDFAGHVLKWEYEPFKTKITNESTSSVTVEEYTSADEVNSITHGYGTSKATTESFTYNERGEPLTHTDGKGYTTSYEYNSEGDRTKLTDPESHETKWTYNAKHEPTSETLPSGEKTTIEYDEHGNPIKVSRPAPEEKTQATRYEYNTLGEQTAMIDPLERKWTYGYNEAGDRTSETDPEGDKTTRAYNKDSQQTNEVSPRGNVTGGKPSEYTTTFTRDALGRVTKVKQPEAQETIYAYNADNNVTSITDPNGHKTTIGYTFDGLPSKVTQANGNVMETTYNGANLVTAQIDGNKHTTKYVRNVLGQVTEIVDPLEHKTKETYDAAGNTATLTDAANRTTTFSYNKENEPTKISYSESSTHAAEYEYTPNGQISSMIDGTGTTSYTYDQLGRLTETKNGHGDTAAYGYDLANETTSIKYPNGKTVKDGYDKAGRLNSVADWLSHTTGFAYNPDSQPTTTTFPETSGESDHGTYNRTDQPTETSMLKGSETLASIAYLRDLNGQASKETQTGLPGEAAVEYGYDVNERLTKAGATVYEYDPANNPTKIGSASNTFNVGDELTEGGGVTYAYDNIGERTKATPTPGPATTYGYNQAGVLTSVMRPEEGSIPKIEDTYTYDGNNLRASETINGTTKHLTWQFTSTVPVLLNDGTNSYIYGPGGAPIEQINGEEHATYLHHDQQGSTRLLTNEKGEVAGAYSYGAYGATTGHTGTAITPLGYDAQYTNADTGLIYLRARSYDPATAQFLSRDPLTAVTGAPYTYAADNPLNASDPTGLDVFEAIGEGIAGWGDTITFGGTNWVREELGINNINTCSSAYQAGGVAGLATGVLIPGEGEVEIGAEGLSISAKIARQMESRGWTEEEIQEAIKSGEQVQAVNKATGNPATRYINPKTGQSVVLDNTTKEVIHVGGPGFRYGPGSGDLP
jgi:RHS repeat-associated protein